MPQHKRLYIQGRKKSISILLQIILYKPHLLYEKKSMFTQTLNLQYISIQHPKTVNTPLCIIEKLKSQTSQGATCPLSPLGKTPSTTVLPLAVLHKLFKLLSESIPLKPKPSLGLYTASGFVISNFGERSAGFVYVYEG